MKPSSPHISDSLENLLLQLPDIESREFSRLLTRFESGGFETHLEVELFCQKWEIYCASVIAGSADLTLLHPLASLFQFPGKPSFRTILIDLGLPPLRMLFEQNCHERASEFVDDWLFLLKILVALDTPDHAGKLLLDVLHNNFGAESFVWGVIYEQFDPDSPWTRLIWENLSQNLPDLFSGICFLDLSNSLAEHSEFLPHSFDSPLGHNRLREWLESDDPGEESYAISAAQTLPWLRRLESKELLDLALQHDSEEVQFIAANVAAQKNDPRGYEILRELCLNPVTSRRAIATLTAAHRQLDIPPETREPEFLALAEFCSWLIDPENFGEIADEIDCIGHTKIYWPPTNDEREFYFFRYSYFSDCQEVPQADEIGVGVVGSTTVSLVGHTKPEMPLREILALHCCWELQQLNHPQAPPLLSIEEGIKCLDWNKNRPASGM